MSRATFSIPALGLLSLSFLAGCEEPPAPFCGDGEVNAEEECDDANNIDTDECPSTCLNAACGDSFVESGVEECDDANNIDNDACTNDCTNAECGDGIVFNQAGGVEGCDDQNQNNNDGCLNNCEADPIINSFTITTHRGTALVDKIDYDLCTSYGTYGGCYAYTECDLLLDGALTVNGALSGAGSYSRDRTCVDANFTVSQDYALSGAVTVVTPKVQYNINLTEGAANLTLSCTMNAGLDLNCTDNNNAAWVLDTQ